MTIPAAVLFDWDGTIVDSHEAILRSYEEVIERHTGRPVRFEGDESLTVIGRRPHEVFSDHEIADVAAASSAYNEAYKRAAAASGLFPGVRAMLARLQQAGIVLGVVTNKGRQRLHVDIERFELDGIFDIEVCAEDTRFRKPHPDPILLGIDRSGLPREAIVYVGDNPVDIVAAHAAGVKAVAALWGPFPLEALWRRGPDRVADDPEALVSWVLRGGDAAAMGNGATTGAGGGGRPHEMAVSVGIGAGSGPFLFGQDLGGALASIEDVAWSGMELAVRRVVPDDVHTVTNAIEGHRVRVVAVSTDRMAVEDGITLADPATHREACDRLEAAYRLAATFECPLVLGAVLGGRAHGASERSAMLQQLVERRIGGEPRAPVLFEPGHRFLGGWATTVGEAIEFVEAAPFEHAGLALSTLHLMLGETSMAAAIRSAGRDLHLVHLTDANGLAPGLGELDLVSLVRALEKSGYDGPYVLRCEPRPDSVSALGFAARSLRSYGLGPEPESEVTEVERP